ncbi:thiamine pyrophosphate-binding protein [Paenibacillus sp. JSM ZJ436]|uniref:thiamine pyrophosphate-binding protein n=1 Tax=Paenibacillus sp. JSM ZJ436 TaxID=3376190 RepID=UPI0037B7C95D
MDNEFVKDIISIWLKKLKVDRLFGIPGSYVLPLIDSAARHEIPFILSQHEYGAALMADGYAKATGKVGCVITTTGIGATNALSGIYNSYSDSQPVLFITGQVPTSQFGKGALQESAGIGRSIHMEEFFAKVTKLSKMVTSAEEVLDSLQVAEHALLEGRKGPVHLCIPIDVLQTRIPFFGLKPSLTRSLPVMPENTIREIHRLTEGSEKPLLLLGAGCQTDEVASIAKRLADKGIPVATTLRGKGIVDEAHPLALGCVGMYGDSSANYYLDRHADLLIAVGVSMSEFTTQCWDPSFSKPRLVHVDIDQTQIGKNYEPDLAVHADAQAFLTVLLQAAGEHKKGLKFAEEAVRATKSKFDAARAQRVVHSEEEGKLHPVEVVELIQKAIPAEQTVWVSDSVTWTETHLKLSGANRHIEAVNQASIGYTPAAAIGVKVGLPDRYVVAVFGDGGFRQTAMELATAVSYNIPVLWVNLNNEKYGSIYAAQKSYYDGNIVGTTYAPIDFVKFGESLGVEAMLIESPEALEEACESFRHHERPLLLDVRINDAVPVAKARQLIRYQQWKLTKPTREHSSSEDLKVLNQLIQNRY